MDIASIIAVILLVGITLWWVLKPLWGRSQEQVVVVSLEEQELTELKQRRDGLYKTIKDLELDREAGKISGADYEQARTSLMQQAALILQQIDYLSQDIDHKLETEIDSLLASAKSNGALKDKTFRKAVRAELMAEVQQIDQYACPACSSPVNSNAAYCSQCGIALTLSCPNCKHIASPGDLFCSYCGTRLAVEVTE